MTRSWRERRSPLAINRGVNRLHMLNIDAMGHQRLANVAGRFARICARASFYPSVEEHHLAGLREDLSWNSKTAGPEPVKFCRIDL